MKIVHIITRMILGGAQENTLLTCEGLHQRGHEVTLITGPALGPEGQLMDRARSGGYRVIELDRLRRAINPFYDMPVLKQLRKLLEEIDPDIVHTHSAKAGILGRRAAATLRKKTTHACCPTLEKFRAAQSAGCGRPRIIHTIHGLAFHPYQSSLLNYPYIAVERSAANYTDAFICVARAMTDQALAAGIGQKHQYTRIFSGLESETFVDPPSAQDIAKIRRDLEIPKDTVVIATVARLFELKGHDYIIDAARQITQRHHNVVWLFIGDGNLRSSLEQKIAAYNLTPYFRLSGLVPPERVGPLLHASDILVHCSLREGLARALPQALLCGKPAISFDVDGAREVIINDKTGCLIPPKDILALITAQEKLIADRDLRLRLGRAGRNFCRQEFDKNLMIERIEKLYQSQVTLLPLIG
ncbi:MAG: glycosyltransferase family 4 protein [Planctomycetes bacterium]|nr:glycosyltransferase family 4 protein [Planctomycetota bacterium]